MSEGIGSPIAQVDPRFAMWRKVRVPLFSGIALVVLVVSGLLIRSCVIARGIRADLAHAAELAASDTIEGHEEALDVLEQLRADYPDHEAIRTRFAWQHVLMALRLGPVEEHVQAAEAALGEGADAQTALLAATRAGLLLAQGDAEGAAELARATREQAPQCRECAFVQGLALAELGRTDEAVPVLDDARQGRPSFLPALAALGEVLRDVGRLPEAHNALKVLAQAKASHRGAKVQSVLVELDKIGATPVDGAKVVGPLRGHLKAVTIDDAHPRRAAFRHYAEGRLSLLEGNAEEAASELAVAAKVLTADQALAMWRAIALRRTGRLAEAVDAMSAFPDSPDANLGLLRIRAEVLLDMHRTRDAAAPIAILVQKNVKGAVLLEGRRLLAAGETTQALKVLERARAAGEGAALAGIVEAHALRGRVDLARSLVKALPESGAYGSCAKGYYAYLRGSTARAKQHWDSAARGGARCGNTLPGRLLLGTGRDDELRPGLEKALAERQDARDRVALGRLLLRLEGGAAAGAELDAVRAMEPQGAQVLSELVDAYVELGRRDVALEVATAGVSITKGHPLVVAAASRLAREAGQLDDADRIVADGLKARPSSPELLLEQGRILVARRRYPDAEEVTNKALRPGPLFAEAACLRATIFEKRGNRQDAQISLNRSAARAPTKSGVIEAAEIRACLVDHFIRRGRPSFGKARGNLFLLRSSGITAWSEVPYLAGVLSEREGERDDAESQFRRVIKLDPARRDAWQQLSKLGVLTDEDRARLEKLWPGQPLEE